MAERKREMPEADDLVIDAVKVVMYYGAYAKMGGQCVFRREK